MITDEWGQKHMVLTPRTMWFPFAINFHNPAKNWGVVVAWLIGIPSSSSSCFSVALTTVLLASANRRLSPITPLWLKVDVPILAFSSRTSEGGDGRTAIFRPWLDEVEKAEICSSVVASVNIMRRRIVAEGVIWTAIFVQFRSPSGFGIYLMIGVVSEQINAGLNAVVRMKLQHIK